MPNQKVVKVREYNNKGKQQIQNYNIDKLRVCAVSYNLEGAKFSKIYEFFTKLISSNNLDTTRIDVLVVGLQEVKNTIKTRELHKLSGLSVFKHITILGGKGILRGATRLIIFSKYQLKITPAIDNIKKTFKTIKNIIIADISLSLGGTVTNNEKKKLEAKKETTHNAIQFSVLNCHLPKDTLKTYITDDKLSKLNFHNNIILGDFNSRTEFVYTDNTNGRKGNKTKKVPLTEKNKYNRNYDAILKQLEGKSLKNILESNKQNKGEPVFTDTLHNHKTGKLKEYRELKNLSGNTNPKELELPQNPTYKINPKTGNYVYFKKEKRTKKLRVPSYADRILVTGRDILIDTYKTLSAIRLSDHLPIMGIYTVKKDTYKYPVKTTTGDYDGTGLLSTYHGDMVSGTGAVSGVGLGAVSGVGLGAVSGADVVDAVSEHNNGGLVSAVEPNNVNPREGSKGDHSSSHAPVPELEPRPEHGTIPGPRPGTGSRSEPKSGTGPGTGSRPGPGPGKKPKNWGLGLPKEHRILKQFPSLPNPVTVREITTIRKAKSAPAGFKPGRGPGLQRNIVTPKPPSEHITALPPQNISHYKVTESVHSDFLRESYPKQPFYDLAMKEAKHIYDNPNSLLGSHHSTYEDPNKPSLRNKSVQTSNQGVGVDKGVGPSPPPLVHSGTTTSTSSVVGKTPTPTPRPSTPPSKKSSTTSTPTPTPTPPPLKGNYKGPNLRKNPMGLEPGEIPEYLKQGEIKHINPEQEKEPELIKILAIRRKVLEAVEKFKTLIRKKKPPSNDDIKQISKLRKEIAILRKQRLLADIKKENDEINKIDTQLNAIVPQLDALLQKYPLKGGSKKRSPSKSTPSKRNPCKRKTKKRKHKNKNKTRN